MSYTEYQKKKSWADTGEKGHSIVNHNLIGTSTGRDVWTLTRQHKIPQQYKSSTSQYHNNSTTKEDNTITSKHHIIKTP